MLIFSGYTFAAVNLKNLVVAKPQAALPQQEGWQKGPAPRNDGFKYRLHSTSYITVQTTLTSLAMMIKAAAFIHIV